MNKYLSILLFIAFILLCGAEIGPKFLSSAQKKSGDVLYIRSAKQPIVKKNAEKKQIDYKKLIEGINGNGA